VSALFSLMTMAPPLCVLQVTATLLEMVKTIVLECLQPERNGLKWAGVE
jgi:hypothetical protein